MKVIRPEPVTQSELLSTNITETASEWDEVTEYEVGDIAKVTSVAGGATTNTLKKYTAIKGSAEGTADGATTTTATLAAAATSIPLATAGTGTILQGDYVYIGDDTENEYLVITGESDVSTGGTLVIYPGLAAPLATSTAHAVTLVKNLSKDPTTETDWWEELSSVEHFKMFNNTPSEQSESADSIVVSVKIPGVVNSVSLINTEANSVTIVQTVNNVEKYNQTFSLNASGGVGDEYEYAFEPIDKLKEYVRLDLPIYENATFDITLTATGETVKCGGLVFGQHLDLGDVNMGARLSNKNYTEKTDIGNGTAFADYARTTEFEIVLDSGGGGAMRRFLENNLGVPLVWVGSDTVEGVIIFGYYINFDVILRTVNQDICVIQFEELT